VNFYTNVSRHKNNILVRGIKDGVPYKKSLRYKPYLFVSSNKSSKYKNIKNEYVGKVDFNSMSEAREFLETYKDVSGAEVYGLTDFVYLFIHDAFPNELAYDPSQISVVYLDIEVDIKNGYPNMVTASNEITAITISRNGKITSFGCGEYKEHKENIKYYRCKNEKVLLQTFLEVWRGSEYCPDVVTGWNVEFFDIPYLIKRIQQVLGEKEAASISPWNILKEYEVEIRGQINHSFVPVGISVLDYLNLYKKFTYTQQESYRLNHIAYYELGEKKLDFSEFANLNELQEKDYQKYIEYNIRDVELVELLEDKMKLIELVYALAYDAKINHTDTLTSVKQWDVIIHNYLKKSNIVIPQIDRGGVNKPLVGGYVKTPKIGLSKWVVSMDLNSLYPHLIMQYNISPETFVTRIDEHMSIEQILKGDIDKFKGYLEKNNTAIAANLCLYSKEKRGFLPSLMETMYEDRAEYKNKMIEVKKEYEKSKDKKLLKEISRLDNLQMAKKIQLNCAYGALGNKYFRWYDINHAEAITMSGQLSIRWIENKINTYMNKVLKTEGKDYVIASDTDSIYITMHSIVSSVYDKDTDDRTIVKFIDKLCKERIEPYIEKCYVELATYMNAFSQKMKMKRENIANKGIWKAKKMYILNVWNSEGVQYDKPKLKMMGIESVRSSTPASCRDNIKNALDIIMNKDEKDLHLFIENFKKEFFNLNFEDVAFPRGVKDIKKWLRKDAMLYEKGTPIHVKGSILYNDLIDKKGVHKKYEKISDGEKIKFSYLKKPNPYGISVISCPTGLPAEFGLNKFIDYETQFDKAFLEPIKSILTTIGWHTEKKATLEDFFS